MGERKRLSKERHYLELKDQVFEDGEGRAADDILSRACFLNSFTRFVPCGKTLLKTEYFSDKCKIKEDEKH